MKPASYRHILKFTSLLGSVQCLYVLLAMARNKITTVLIGSVGLGLNDILLRTATLVGDTTNFGISFSAIRRLSILYDEGKHDEMRRDVLLIRTWTLFTALLGAAVCLLAAPLISQIIDKSPALTTDVRWLAPVVAFLTLTAGEVSILKAIRQLKRLALITTLGAVATICTTAPLYFLLGLSGIVPALVCSTGAVFLLNLWGTWKHFPYRVELHKWDFIRRGRPLLVLGAAYIAAGVCGSGSEFAVRAMLHDMSDDWGVVGLYTAGFTLTANYARLIFVAMDADYFPRLSAALGHKQEMNVTINRQIEVLVMLMAPFLVVFCLALPLIVRILYTAEFIQIIPMVLLAASYMFFKAVFSPVAYLPLAAGHASTYMVMEVIYDAFFIAAVVVGYEWWGLAGAGVALSVSNLFNLVLVFGVYAMRYHFRIRPMVLLRTCGQYVLLCVGLAAACLPSIPMKAAFGVLLVLMSMALSSKTIRALLHKN